MKLQNNFVLGLLALTAAAGMVSCSSDEPAGSVNNDSTEAISLDTYVARNVTRASVETKATLETNGFGVFGYYSGSSSFSSSIGASNLMSKQQVEYKDSKWTYTPVKYWSKTASDKYQFLAYAPFKAGDNISEGTAEAATAPVLTYDGTNNGGYDFMTALRTDVTKPANNGTVDFQFQHRLTRLGVMVKTSAAYTATITVKKVVLKNAKLKGTYTLWSEATTAGSGWTANSEATDFTVYNNTTGTTITSTAANIMGSDAYVFAIPSTAALQLVVDYEISQNDNKVTYSYTNQAVDFPSTVYAMGTGYNLVLSIGLDAITFNVTSVTDWGNTTDVNGSNSL
jgi:hypothetical protein